MNVLLFVVYMALRSLVGMYVDAATLGTFIKTLPSENNVPLAFQDISKPA